METAGGGRARRHSAGQSIWARRSSAGRTQLDDPAALRRTVFGNASSVSWSCKQFQARDVRRRADRQTQRVVELSAATWYASAADRAGDFEPDTVRPPRRVVAGRT